ncbi:MAG: orotate phosphoribosyltransferase [Candidatus Eisenbacteria bacterium]|nr:orotate phosphoribosyltransferase [Candidatus Eisenbacteria bacterium]
MTGTTERVLELLAESGALLKGHFRLSSGRHSDEYCQCARVLERPEAAEELGAMLAELFVGDDVDAVVSPALGGIIIGHEVARALGVRCLFAEREDGRMTLRRGFALREGERALIIEDVRTTGGSVLEVAEVVRAAGAVVAGFGFILDRSREPRDLGAPARALARRPMESHEPERCPLCADGVPVVKPGSRPGTERA